MKFKLIICLFLTVLGLVKLSYAQHVEKKDTIYYLVETTNNAAADRMVNIENAAPYKFYTINCPCLSNGNKPVFRSNINKQTQLDKNKFNHLKLVHLADLIEIVRKNDDSHFDDKYIIFFLEPFGRGHKKQQVFFLGGL